MDFPTTISKIKMHFIIVKNIFLAPLNIYENALHHKGSALGAQSGLALDQPKTEPVTGNQRPVHSRSKTNSVVVGMDVAFGGGMG